jgi:hypothetical protein
VAIVNQAMARYYFPGADPIGKHVAIDRNPKDGGWFGGEQPYEIVGVVGDVKAVELRDAPRPTIYFNMFQEARLTHQFELRTATDPESVAVTARRIVRDILPSVPVTRVTTLDAQVDSNIVPERLIATLSEFFGCLAALLAGIGLYGLLAFTVARRTNEIGIRMALGATSTSVSRLVLRDVLVMVCAGLAAGTWLVYLGKPLAAAVLPDVHWQSAAPLAIGGGAMIVVALLSSYIPVRRAARVDPMVALRHCVHRSGDGIGREWHVCRQLSRISDGDVAAGINRDLLPKSGGGGEGCTATQVLSEPEVTRGTCRGYSGNHAGGTSIWSHQGRWPYVIRGS